MDGAAECACVEIAARKAGLRALRAAYGYGEGESVPDMGKYTVTLRRSRGGPWQLFSDMDNGNQSRRPAPLQ